MKVTLMLAPVAILAASTGQAQQVFYQEVSWSPDGTRLSYTTIQTEAPWTSDIILIDPDGKGRTPVPHGLASARWAAWHPDGTRLAFAGKDGDNWDLYVIDLTTEAVTRLTDTEANESAPSWSPDGTALVFTAGVSGRSQVFRMNADGTGRTNLSQSSREDSNPVWSPDGERIVFYAAPDTSRDHLWTMRPDGSDQRQLTNGRLRDTFPSWAPDGGSIVFARQRLNTSGVYRMTLEGSVPTEVIEPAFYARLSPDGTRVAYIRGRWPTAEIWVGGTDQEPYQHKRIRN